MAVAYLAVALKLFDPQAVLSPDLEKRIAPQMAQITRAGGREKSALFPAFEDDYGAYKPVGHYSGDPDLETYFQGMTWYGRVQFNFTEVGDLTYQPGKEPLIISTALRRAQIGNRPVYEDWLALHEILNFVIGPSDDPGPLALLALMDQVYGVKPTLAALGDETLWNRFLTGASALPSSQINSTFAASLDDLPKSRGWRFMGQRFTLDVYILQNLLFDRVGTLERRRDTPSGLDVMAALGSPSAITVLENLGETGYHNYPEQMTRLQQVVEQMPEAEWLTIFTPAGYTLFAHSFQKKAQCFLILCEPQPGSIKISMPRWAVGQS